MDIANVVKTTVEVQLNLSKYTSTLSEMEIKRIVDRTINDMANYEYFVCRIVEEDIKEFSYIIELPYAPLCIFEKRLKTLLDITVHEKY